MALILADRVKETTDTTGTGTVTLSGASPGFQSFAAIGNGNQTFYTIAGGGNWEVGIGTYTASGTTLSRDTILSSSNSGSAVNFSAGTKDVFVTYPSEYSVLGAGGQAIVTNNTVVNDSTTIQPGFNAQSIGPITISTGKFVTVPSGNMWVVFSY